MTKQEVIERQRHLAITGFLKFAYCMDAEKCCNVYPKLCHKNTNDKYHDTYIQCEVCGKQTELFGMPWVAKEAWNKHEYQGKGVQLSFL